MPAELQISSPRSLHRIPTSKLYDDALQTEQALLIGGIEVSKKWHDMQKEFGA